MLLPRIIMFGQNVSGAPEFCMMARTGEVCRGQAVMLVRLVRPVRKHKRIR